MNVLIVHNFYQQPGGEDQVFADEAALLEKHGHTVGRFTMDNDAIDGMGRLEVARKTIWNSAAKQNLREAIRQIRAEVVHFHNTFPLISPAGYYAAHEEGAAVVQTLHNYRLLCPAATMFRRGTVCEQCLGRAVPWPGVVHKCYHNSMMATAAIAGMLGFHRFKGTWCNEVDLYVALTEFSRQKFIQGGLPSEKIAIKQNFVDPDPGIGSGAGNFFLFVGRLTEEKGVKTLLNAWKPLYQKARIPLKIVGDGPLRDWVLQSLQEQSGIEYLGRRPPAEVYDMMGAARALVFPSLWYEGQPRTIVESLAKGTPVLASRLGSMPELIDHHRTGRLFATGDSVDLCRQAEEMFALSEADRALMRQAARREFESRYTAAQNYPILIDCYEKARARAQIQVNLTKDPADAQSKSARLAG
jgi:glycosyltransferase involved in cell wall biosynthesis